MTTCHIAQGDARVLAWKIKTPINCIITDPPYGMAHESGRAVTADAKRFAAPIAGDRDFIEAQSLFVEVMLPLVYKAVEHCDMYVFCRWDMVERWGETIDHYLSPFRVSNCIVWDKVMHGMGDLEGSWANCHEMILYAKKGRRPVNKRMPNVISVERLSAKEMIHPTEKPVHLLERLITVSTNEGDLIVDPFCGSGSTIWAAQRTGRNALGFEIDTDNQYVERGRARLQQVGLFS